MTFSSYYGIILLFIRVVNLTWCQISHINYFQYFRVIMSCQNLTQMLKKLILHMNNVLRQNCQLYCSFFILVLQIFFLSLEWLSKYLILTFHQISLFLFYNFSSYYNSTCFQLAHALIFLHFDFLGSLTIWKYSSINRHDHVKHVF